MEDTLAISRLKQGNIAGLESLVQKYQAQAVNTAYMIVFERSLAEEIVQSAFVRVAEKIGQFDESRPFAPWFYRIVTNEAVRVSKQQRRLMPLEVDSDEKALALAKILADPQPQPEKLVEFREAQQVLMSALRQLQPEQRAVVVMRYYLEMSEADMSARLERPLSTIKWWLRSAREHLQKRLRASRLFEEQE